MTVPIIFRDVNFHIYTISPDCIIRKNGCSINVDDTIYHSTNGYDYVLLETLSGDKRLYRLEFIMVSSFNPGIQNKWEHFKVNHIDGDIKNCHIDNLTFEEDVEEWRIIEYPECIRRNQYAISSWGRVMFIPKKHIVGTINQQGYPYIHIIDSNQCTQHLLIHRIMMSVFITNIMDTSSICVNHIDGDKTNNHLSNLEITSRAVNNQHAVISGLRKYTSKISTEEIDMIIEMLLDPKYEGSLKAVFNVIHDKYPHITYNNINDIKIKCKSYIRKGSRFDLKSIQFPVGFTGVKSKILTEEIDMIIEMLLDPKYEGSPKLVYAGLDHNRFPDITYDVISGIRNKRTRFIRSDSKYDLRHISFVKRKNKITSSEVDMVIELLLSEQYNHSVTRVYEVIDHVKHPYITKDIIAHIKCHDKSYCKLAKKFDLNSISFNIK